MQIIYSVNSTPGIEKGKLIMETLAERYGRHDQLVLAQRECLDQLVYEAMKGQVK